MVIEREMEEHTRRDSSINDLLEGARDFSFLADQLQKSLPPERKSISHHDVSGISQYQLPPLWRSSPRLMVSENQVAVRVHRITSVILRYTLTLSAWDMDTISDISDIIHSSPPTETYLAL